VRLRHRFRRNRGVRLLDDDGDRQRVFLGELEVALVVARHAHHRAGAVFAEHEVGDPDRHRLSGEWIDRLLTGIESFLATHPRLAVLGAERLDLRPEVRGIR
jgi:hypothetical protein